MALKINNMTVIPRASAPAVRKQKNNLNRKLQIISESTIASLCCPHCKKPFAEGSVARLKPRRKLSPKMQKLIRRKRENEESLTEHQKKLVYKAWQCSNSLVLACGTCPWKGEKELQTRKESHRQKRRLDRSTGIQTAEPENNNIVVDKMTKKKMKKKERKKKVAERKALQLATARQANKPLLTDPTTQKDNNTALSDRLPSVSPQQQNSTAPSASLQKKNIASSPAVQIFHAQPEAKAETLGNTTDKARFGGKNVTNYCASPKMTVGTIGKAGKSRPPGASFGVQGNRTQFDAGRGTPNKGVKMRGGKQQLQKMLSQQKKGGLSAGESLSLFLNSLK